jgi:hypothetical protein
MHRTLARIVFVLIVSIIGAGLGVAAAVLYTPPGRSLLVRLVTSEADRMVRGTVSIGAVHGGWVNGISLERVVIRDTAGDLLAEVPRIDISYRLGNFLSGQVVLNSLHARRPVLQIIKHRSGRLNYEDIFRLGESRSVPGGRRQLVEIHDLRIDSGTVTIRLPWNPDGRLRTQRQVDSALAFERAKPGRRIEKGPEGLELIRTLDDLHAEMPLVRVSSPDDGPVTVVIDRLASKVSDPDLRIVDLKAQLRTKNDSLTFNVERAELPRTSLSGAGRIDWPQDTIQYRFGLEAPRLALADLRFISPGFPDFTGKGSVQARSVSNSRIEYDIRDLVVGDAGSRVSGRLVAITDIYQGLGFRRLGLNLANLDLDVVRPYLDSIPFYGKITGRLSADGFFKAMTVSLDWSFTDAKVAGAQSRLALDGLLHLGGAEGMVFEGARLSETDVDLRTVRLVSPAVILEGRLSLNGSLNGPWKNVVFDGTAEHRDDDRPPSRLSGKVRLDTRGAVLGLTTDVVLDSLSFDGIRRTFPTLEAQGSLGGTVKLNGTLERLAVDMDVAGAIGQIRALGVATVTPPRWAADSLRVTFSRVNLAALTRSSPVTSLEGNLVVTGTVDSATAPEGRMAISLGKGRIREFNLDSATALLSAADGLITLDTLRAAFAGGSVSGSGSIGWEVPKTGKMTVHAEATDLAPFDSLGLALTGFSRDSTADNPIMEGKATADLTLRGALGDLQLEGTVLVNPFRWLGYKATNLRSQFAWASRDSVITASVSADSLIVRSMVFSSVTGSVQGRADSLRWAASLVGRDSAQFVGAGRYQARGDVSLFHADSLGLTLFGREWRLDAPLDARLHVDRIELDTVRLVTRDGSGSVEARGDFSRGAPSDLTVTALGVELRDIYALTQRDTTGTQGSLSLDARVTGTSKAPELRGTATLTGGIFGDFRAPLIRTAFDYRGQVLRSNLTFWRTGVPVVELDATLPLDLAFTKVPRRQLPGPIVINATGDSVDLAIVEAFTPNLRRVTGSLSMDVRVEGSWETPRLAGEMRFMDGGADIPAIGVRYAPIRGALRFVGDSILSDNVKIGGGAGELAVTGGLRLERLTQPILGLTLSAREFDLMDVREYMRLQAWGDVSLTGPLFRPVLTGAGRLTNSVIWFSDLVTKEIVNLDDPLNADLVDTLALRKQGLRADFQSRFLDSLSIRDLDFIVGENVWLRSYEANFQLEGRLRVNKTLDVYRMEGSLSTPRGSYTLEIGPIRRIFTVERGSVRYFGDLNAELDVQARHVLAAQSATETPVIAHITGTLQAPELSLSTPPDKPPRSEPELISLLVVGSDDPRAAAQFGLQPGPVATAWGLNIFAGELQRTLMSGGGDIVEIRPGISYSLLGNVTAATQIAVGKSLGSKLFVTANAGFCTNERALSAQNLGASVEYRFRRDLRMVISAEPVRTCFGLGAEALAASRRYQFGADLRWDREYR